MLNTIVLTSVHNNDQGLAKQATQKFAKYNEIDPQNPEPILGYYEKAIA